MAEEAKKNPDASAAPPAKKDEAPKGEKPKAKGLLTKTPVLLGGVMLDRLADLTVSRHSLFY